MSGRVTKMGTDKENCPTPGGGEYPVGTVWRCECGRRWKLETTPFYGSRHWRRLASLLHPGRASVGVHQGP